MGRRVWAALTTLFLAGCSDGGASLLPLSTLATPAPTPEPTPAVSPTPPEAPPAPFRLIHVEPAAGPVAGGTGLTLFGSAFAAGATVRIGDAECAQPNVISTSKMTCTTTAGVAGTHAVTVSLGNEATVLPAAFRYFAAPTLSSINPATGVRTGGVAITLQGANFSPGAAIMLGNLHCTDVIVVSSALAQCKTPVSAAAATVDVTLRNPDGSEDVLAGAFRFVNPAEAPSPVVVTNDTTPLVAAVVPPSGTLAGGNTVRILGARFAAGSTVKFGNADCGSVVNHSENEIRCVVPAGTRPGNVSILVSSPDGTLGLLPEGYGYNVVPAIASATPSRGPSAGGTLVTLRGAGFRTGVSVQIGASACTGLELVTSETLRCTTPSGSEGAALITLTNGDGSSATLAQGFTFDGAPAVASVTPASALRTGGSWISISGSGFLAGASILLGDKPCITPLVLSGGLAQCLLPASETTGAVDVRLTNADGQSGVRSAGFTYLAVPDSSPTAPVVFSMSPRFGPPAGGTSVTLTGAHFLAGDSVRVGNTNCGSVTVVSPTSIQCVTVASPAGIAPVVVTRGDGTASAVSVDFLFSAAPQIESISPSNVSIVGGERISIQGEGFMAGATVTVGGSPCTDVVLTSGGALSCSTPALTAGVKSLVVANPDGQSATHASALAYRSPAPTVSNTTPQSGPSAGGATLTVTGTGFVNGLVAKLNDRVCASVNVASSTSFTCTTPAHTAGVFSTLVVTLPDGQSASYPLAYRFDAPPTVATVTPARGPLAGGTSILLQGAGFLPGLAVTVGGSTCTSLEVLDATSARCVTAAHAAGAVPLVATLLDGQSSTLANGFVYDAAPSLTAVAPNTGRLSGGNTVLVSGTGFQQGMVLKVGGKTCLSLQVQSSANAACVVPAGSLGAVALEATNPDGQSATLAAAYRYTPQNLGLSCNAVVGDFGAALASKPCTETSPETGTLAWSLTGCPGVGMNATTGQLTGTIPASPCQATVTLTSTNTLLALQESIAASLVVSPQISLSWNGNPTLSEQCELTLPGTTLLQGGATWSNGTGSAIAKATTTTASATGISGTLTDFSLGSFTATWSGQSVSPSSTASPLVKNLTLGTGGPGSISARPRSADYFANQSMGRELPRAGCGALCETPTVGGISVGGNHVCALADNGAYCWGRGDFGQVGHNATPATPVTAPTKVHVDAAAGGLPDLSGATFTSFAISIADRSGYYTRSTCGILSDKTVACWMRNDYGELGDGTGAYHGQSRRVTGLTGVKQITGGYAHFCALREDGTVWCWGYNGNGRLGDGTNTDRTSPVRMHGLSGVTHIAAGYAHVCAVSQGEVWCSGSNGYGQLGDGTTSDRWEPVKVQGISNAIQVGVGVSHSCALLQAGTVKCWGRNPNGELGDNTGIDRLAPVSVVGNGIADVVEISIEYYTGCARNAAGALWCWGYNGYGNIGDGTTTSRNQAVRVNAFGPDLGKPAVAALFPGRSATCAITDAASNHSLWCWGWNGNWHVNYGQLGLGVTGSTTVPTYVMENVQTVATRLFAYHDGTNWYYAGLGVGLTRDGAMWTWGAAEDDTWTPNPEPARAGAVLQVAAGLNHTCAMLSGGRLRCWGYNGHGQHAVGDTSNRAKGAGHNTVKSAVGLDAGDHHTCYLTSTAASEPQKVMCVGRNNFGQLGDLSNTSRSFPVPATLGSEAARLVATGAHHTCAATEAGGAAKVRCWGLNASGQVGNGTTANVNSPQVVLAADGTPIADAVRMLAAGGDHSCALLSEGTVRCWGGNSFGQLGNGTTVSSNRAVPVTGLTNVAAITAGFNHTCALARDMRVWCWGSNVDGNLGDGTTTLRTLPVLTREASGAPLGNVVAIDAGQQTTCALVDTGSETSSVKCWGNGSWGQMGNGTTSATNVNPVTVTPPAGTAWTRQRGCRAYVVTAP